MTDKVLLSYCEWDDYSNLVFKDAEAFRKFFTQDWFLKEFLDDGDNYEDLIDHGLLGYRLVEVIGS